MHLVLTWCVLSLTLIITRSQCHPVVKGSSEGTNTTETDTQDAQLKPNSGEQSHDNEDKVTTTMYHEEPTSTSTSEIYKVVVVPTDVPAVEQNTTEQATPTEETTSKPDDEQQQTTQEEKTTTAVLTDSYLQPTDETTPAEQTTTSCREESSTFGHSHQKDLDEYQQYHSTQTTTTPKPVAPETVPQLGQDYRKIVYSGPYYKTKPRQPPSLPSSLQGDVQRDVDGQDINWKHDTKNSGPVHWNHGNSGPVHWNHGNSGSVHGNHGNSRPVHGNHGNSGPVHGNHGNSRPVHGNHGNSGPVHGNHGNSEPVHWNHGNWKAAEPQHHNGKQGYSDVKRFELGCDSNMLKTSVDSKNQKPLSTTVSQQSHREPEPLTENQWYWNGKHWNPRYWDAGRQHPNSWQQWNSGAGQQDPNNGNQWDLGAGQQDPNTLHAGYWSAKQQENDRWDSGYQDKEPPKITKSISWDKKTRDTEEYWDTDDKSDHLQWDVDYWSEVQQVPPEGNTETPISYDKGFWNAEKNEYWDYNDESEIVQWDQDYWNRRLNGMRVSKPYSQDEEGKNGKDPKSYNGTLEEDAEALNWNQLQRDHDWLELLQLIAQKREKHHHACKENMTPQKLHCAGTQPRHDLQDPVRLCVTIQS